MPALTCGEFKELVDKGLKDQGGGDGTEIEYIDISHPCKDHEMCLPCVYFDDGDMAVH